MWLMLQQKEPEDYVVATGEAHSVQEFVEEAFTCIGLDWRKYVEANTPSDMRPAEVKILIGDASKARKKLGWVPRVRFKDLVRMMLVNDLNKYEVGMFS